jgi:UDP-2,3-diacylglucosamine hydrolase
VLSLDSATLLLSDVHLSEDRPAQVERLLALLAGPACKADELLVLGDLFDYWIGDDQCDAPLAARVIAAFAGLAAQGIRIRLLHGNRDFLIGKEFARRAGLELLTDPVCLPIQGTPTILMHGDLLCTDDTAYLAFRAQVRDPAWQQHFLAQPLAVRHQLARGATAESGRAKQQKSEEIMDVTETAVTEVFRRFEARRLIHGHTHRPGHHQYLINGRVCTRWVLPDWYGTGGYLQVTPNGAEERRFDAAN